MENFKYLGILLLFFLSGCDAVNHLSYFVNNQSQDKLKLHIPSYPSRSVNRISTSFTDTIIEIMPKEKIWIGISARDINFPWATKSIYRKNPGICGLELIEGDTVVSLDCTNKTWKYRRRKSTIKIK